MNQFIRIGSLGLSVRDILSYDLNYITHEMQEDESISVSHVRIVTREQTYTDVGVDGWITTSTEHLFKHGSPEANALIIWLTNHSCDLLHDQRFYITNNLYGGHIAHLAEAAQAYNAQLVAVDSRDSWAIPQDQWGYREACVSYLFCVPADSLDKARETVGEIEQLAAMREAEEEIRR